MAALRTEQLEYLLTHLAQTPNVVSLGVFPADCLPHRSRMTARSCCFILNSDKLGKPGKHWLAFHYDAARRVLEYFDSFGLPITFYKTITRAFAWRPTVVEAVNPHGFLQSPDTTTCGYYCVLFLHLRSYQGSAAEAVDIIRGLSSKPLDRDSKVVTFVHKLMHKLHFVELPNITQCVRLSQGCECSKVVCARRK